MERASNPPDTASTQLRNAVKQRPALVFVLLVLVFSWGVWFPLLTGAVSATTKRGMALTILGGFGPAMAAVTTVALLDGSPGNWIRSLLQWRVSLKWYVAAFLLPPSIFVLAALVHSLIIGTPLRLSSNVSLVQYPISILSIAVLGGGQEEFGWRGFLLPALREHMEPISASIVVGIVWAVWHAPLIMITGTDQSQLPIGLYLALILAASILLTWIFEGSNGFLPLAMLFHAGMNAYAYFPAGGLTAARTSLGYGLITVGFAAVAVLATMKMTSNPAPKIHFSSV